MLYTFIPMYEASLPSTLLLPSGEPKSTGCKYRHVGLTSKAQPETLCLSSTGWHPPTCPAAKAGLLPAADPELAGFGGVAGARDWGGMACADAGGMCTHEPASNDWRM